MARVRIKIISLVPLGLALCLHAGILFAQGIPLMVRPAGEKYLYRLGETVEFTVTAGEKYSAKEVAYRLSLDDGKTLSEGVLRLTGGKGAVSGRLDTPGFLRIDISLVQGADTLRAACGVGVEVGAIRPTGILPEDFGLFWRLTRVELLRHPIDPCLEEVSATDPGDARRYKVSLAHPDGGRVYGWLHLPRGKGPFPAVLSIPGSGVGRTGRFDGFTSAGFAVLAIEIFGFEPSAENVGAILAVRDPDSLTRFMQRVEVEELNGYHNLGKEDHWHYIHRRSMIAAMRGMDYLHSRGDIDTSRIAVFGGSQGGGLSLLTAAVDKRAKAVIATVPGSCDNTAWLYGRCGGQGLLASGNRERVIRALSYYDAALAAQLITVPTIIGVGFIDNTCHPTKVYAAYNNLSGPKKIDNFLNTGHESAPGWRERSIEWLKGCFGMK